MAKRRTVTQRLAYRLDRETKLEIISEWAEGRRAKLQEIKDKLDYAWSHDDELAYRHALEELTDVIFRLEPAIKNSAKQLIYGEYKDD